MNPIDRAARTARAGQETAEASAEVIVRRLAIMGEAMLKLQAEALSPIHAAAVANAERLKP